MGDFNKLNDCFIGTHYRYKQVLKKGTRPEAILNKIWTNIGQLYGVPEVTEPLGNSDHNMVFWKPAKLA